MLPMLAGMGGGGMSASSSAKSGNETSVGPITMGNVSFGPAPGQTSNAWLVPALVAGAVLLVFLFWRKK
jgi:hypothetical protein